MPGLLMRVTQTSDWYLGSEDEGLVLSLSEVRRRNSFSLYATVYERGSGVQKDESLMQCVPGRKESLAAISCRAERSVLLLDVARTERELERPNALFVQLIPCIPPFFHPSEHTLPRTLAHLSFIVSGSWTLDDVSDKLMFTGFQSCAVCSRHISICQIP